MSYYAAVAEIPPYGNLKVILTKEGREHFQDWRDSHEEETYYPGFWDDLLEGVYSNSDWGFLQPEEIGALTESVIFASEVDRDDQGTLVHYKDVYWFPEYMVIDPVDLILRDGYIVLTKGSDNSRDDGRDTTFDSIPEGAFTKAEWELNPLRNPTNPEYFCLYVKPGGPETIKHLAQICMNGSGCTREEFLANAQLMRYAPKLYTALKNLIEYLGEHADTEEVLAARQVLFDATKIDNKWL